MKKKIIKFFTIETCCKLVANECYTLLLLNIFRTDYVIQIISCYWFSKKLQPNIIQVPTELTYKELKKMRSMIKNTYDIPVQFTKLPENPMTFRLNLFLHLKPNFVMRGECIYIFDTDLLPIRILDLNRESMFVVDLIFYLQKMIFEQIDYIWEYPILKSSYITIPRIPIWIRKRILFHIHHIILYDIAHKVIYWEKGEREGLEEEEEDHIHKNHSSPYDAMTKLELLHNYIDSIREVSEKWDIPEEKEEVVTLLKNMEQHVQQIIKKTTHVYKTVILKQSL